MNALANFRSFFGFSTANVSGALGGGLAQPKPAAAAAIPNRVHVLLYSSSRCRLLAQLKVSYIY